MSNHNPPNQFKPGQSGNPNGRPPKEWTWAGLLKEVAEEVEPKTGKRYKDLVGKRLWVDAVNGSLGAQREIMNRMEGMPKQRVEGDVTFRRMPKIYKPNVKND
jgi:hypothetical protein